MSKRIYLVCNAHLDPIWQWEWEEGAAEALSTFRVAADLCEAYDAFIFNHNEALLYRWIETYEPSLFRRIRSLVQQGKWHIIGGWHLQPDCNMPSGEGFVRQITEGKRYFLEKFGVEPKTAINFDSFGHTRGLVQILARSGFDSYLFGRPGPADVDLPADLFRWVGYDGSSVTAYRRTGYRSNLGGAADKIRSVADDCADDDFEICLWGVGDHGGGPSRRDLDQITQLIPKMRKEGIELIHATPEMFFDEVRRKKTALPVHAGDLNAWAVGCYTSVLRVKQGYRQLESTMLLTEKMAAAAHVQGLMDYPADDFRQVLYDLSTVQFHDVLPGTSIQPAEESALRMLSHGGELLSRIKAQAFFALSGGQPPAEPDKIPILLYNPHPYAFEGDFACEMMLWDQNWEDNYSIPQVYAEDGAALPTQCEKEYSNLNLDWRKRVVFHATLPPMQMSRFNVGYTRIPKKPAPETREDAQYLYLENDRARVRIDKTTGCPDSYVVDGREMLRAPLCLHIVADNCDPWGMRVRSFPNRFDRFRTLTPDEAQELCGVKGPLAAVRCIESGDVRTSAEALLGYGRSRAVVRYTLPKTSTDLSVELRIFWNETQKMVKLGVPTAAESPECFGQVAFGEEKFAQNGMEHCAQKYVTMAGKETALSVCTASTYGFSAEDGCMYLTLLRSAAFCAHPIGERDILVQDRYTPHMELGERSFRFLLVGGKTDDVRQQTPRKALHLHEPPMALSLFPRSEGSRSTSVFTLTGDPVELTAFKRADDGRGYIVRLFNGFSAASHIGLHAPMLGVDTTLLLDPMRVYTFRISDGALTETDLIEREM